MKKHESKTENEIVIRPTEELKVITRTLLTAFSVPIVCGLPELMTIKRQLQLRMQDGLILGKQPTSPLKFLSGVSMGWVSGGLKSISYANKELICNKISRLRSADHQQNSSRCDAFDRMYASFLVGGIDALTTHASSTMRALLWTNQHAITALSDMPFWMRLRSIYKIGFGTRMLKGQANASCYVAIAPWLVERGKATLPESIAKPGAILCGGIVSGFMCTAMDIIGTHICREAVFTKNQVKASSLIDMYRTLYKQNGLRIFTMGASWNALVSTLAFGTMASIEQFVDSDFFTKTYCFFKHTPNKDMKVSIPAKSNAENQEKSSGCFFKYMPNKELNVPMSPKPGDENQQKNSSTKSHKC